ncbi:MAG: ethanolamine ammonia-lyase reactivating factor EutA [Chloroflexota bacterium]
MTGVDLAASEVADLGGGTSASALTAASVAPRQPLFLHDHGDDEDLPGEDELSDRYGYSGDQVELTSVGIDIGSSTSHLIFSKLVLRRMGKQLSSRFVVVSREVLHRSPILMTPYMADYTINVDRLGTFIQESYQAAGLSPSKVDTGAIILTGEAVKRSNARAIADLFAREAGKFVCVSAGHNLEGVLAAHGSGAASLSAETGQTILNVDIGGGTSKLALMRKGEVLATAATNVGGRLVALDEGRRVIRIEPAARVVGEAVGVRLVLNEVLSIEDEQAVAGALCECLISEIRQEGPTALARELRITPALPPSEPLDAITFSGGVSEFVYQRETRDFHDLSRALSEVLRRQIDAGRLPCPVRETRERIRATVIGASQFTVQVSGNTIWVSTPDLLPLYNLPVLYPRIEGGDDVRGEDVAAAIRASLDKFDLGESDQPVALAIDWNGTPRYAVLRALAEGIVLGLSRSIERGAPLVLVFSQDLGRLIGSIITNDLHVASDVISIDSVEVREFDYIDIGAMLYPTRAVPVVIKSLIFPHGRDARAELVEA